MSGITCRHESLPDPVDGPGRFADSLLEDGLHYALGGDSDHHRSSFFLVCMGYGLVGAVDLFAMGMRAIVRDTNSSPSWGSSRRFDSSTTKSISLRR